MEGVVARGQRLAADLRPLEAPGIALGAVDQHLEGVVAEELGPALGAMPPDRSLGPEEDLLVLARPVLVGLGQEQEIASPAPRAVQHQGQLLAQPPQGDHRHPLQQLQGLLGPRRLLLPEAEDVALGPRPALLGAQGEGYLAVLLQGDPIGELGIGGLLEAPVGGHRCRTVGRGSSFERKAQAAFSRALLQERGHNRQ